MKKAVAIVVVIAAVGFLLWLGLLTSSRPGPTDSSADTTKPEPEFALNINASVGSALDLAGIRTLIPEIGKPEFHISQGITLAPNEQHTVRVVSRDLDFSIDVATGFLQAQGFKPVDGSNGRQANGDFVRQHAAQVIDAFRLSPILAATGYREAGVQFAWDAPMVIPSYEESQGYIRVFRRHNGRRLRDQFLTFHIFDAEPAAIARFQIMCDTRLPLPSAVDESRIISPEDAVAKCRARYWAGAAEAFAKYYMTPFKWDSLRVDDAELTANPSFYAPMLVYVRGQGDWVTDVPWPQGPYALAYECTIPMIDDNGRKVAAQVFVNALSGEMHSAMPGGRVGDIMYTLPGPTVQEDASQPKDAPIAKHQVTAPNGSRLDEAASQRAINVTRASLLARLLMNGTDGYVDFATDNASAQITDGRASWHLRGPRASVVLDQETGMLRQFRCSQEISGGKSFSVTENGSEGMSALEYLHSINYFAHSGLTELGFRVDWQIGIDTVADSNRLRIYHMSDSGDRSASFVDVTFAKVRPIRVIEAVHHIDSLW